MFARKTPLAAEDDYNYCFFPILAPKSISIESPSDSSLEVTVEPNTVSAGVTLYLISTAGKTCQAASTANPLMCALTKLNSATEYTVEAKACFSTTHCSEPIRKKAWTRPAGKLFGA